MYLYIYIHIYIFMSRSSDMWALGVVMFTMLYGQFPFYDSAPQELFNKMPRGCLLVFFITVYAIMND